MILISLGRSGTRPNCAAAHKARHAKVWQTALSERPLRAKSGPSLTIIIYVRNIFGLATEESSHPSMMVTSRRLPLYPDSGHRRSARPCPKIAKMRHWRERCHNDAPMNNCGKSATSALRCIGRLPIQQNIVHPDFHRDFHVRVRQNIEAPVLHRVDRDPCDVGGG